MLPAQDESISLEIDQALAKLDKLHSSPLVALRVMELTRKDEFEMIDVTECLETDPALTASILRLVNSSYYGLPRKITGLNHALNYLGRRSVRLAVLSFGLVKVLVSGAPGRLHQLYWKRSLTMAAAARRCTMLSEDPEAHPDTAFTAGLLADLGMLALAQMETEKYLEICQEPDHMMRQVQMEREAFGFDHMAVGGRLLARWNLSQEMVEAVANHHVYLPMCPELNHTLLVANLLTEVLWNPASPYMKPLQFVLQSRFNMGVDELITLANDTKKAVKESMVIFGVNLKVTIDVDAIEDEAREQFKQAADEEGTFLGGFDALILDS
jgi:HD-like signal output (HDOD) protein